MGSVKANHVSFDGVDMGACLFVCLLVVEGQQRLLINFGRREDKMIVIFLQIAFEAFGRRTI